MSLTAPVEGHQAVSMLSAHPSNTERHEQAKRCEHTLFASESFRFDIVCSTDSLLSLLFSTSKFVICLSNSSICVPFNSLLVTRLHLVYRCARVCRLGSKTHDRTTMPSPEEKRSTDHVVYKLVLTGGRFDICRKVLRRYFIMAFSGPCSGKTTSQARISTFFENLGWKVYRVPETATVLFR